MGPCTQCPVAALARGKQRLVRGVQAPSGFPGFPPSCSPRSAAAWLVCSANRKHMSGAARHGDSCWE